MRITEITSYVREKRGYGTYSIINIDILPEGDIEVALMLALRSGTNEFHINSDGTARVQIKTQRTKHEEATSDDN